MSPERRGIKPNKKDDLKGSKSTRRRFLTRALAGAGVLGLAAVGVGILSHEGESTIENQIEYFERINSFSINDIDDNQTTRDYEWLLQQWYSKFTFGLATKQDFWDHTFLITDEESEYFKEEVKRSPTASGWALEDIYINLTKWPFHHASYQQNRTVVPQLVYFREILTHEMTHFITQKRTDSESIKILSEKMDKKLKYVKGFRLYYDSNENPLFSDASILDNFDEAVTEFIANYYQKFSGFTAGPPNYPEDDQIPGERSKIELVADTLQSTLYIAGIRIDQLAKLHAFSDLDGLAKVFAEKTTRVFKDEAEKIIYGLSIIEAHNSLDHTRLSKYREELKKN